MNPEAFNVLPEIRANPEYYVNNLIAEARQEAAQQVKPSYKGYVAEGDENENNSGIRTQSNRKSNQTNIFADNMQAQVGGGFHEFETHPDGAVGNKINDEMKPYYTNKREIAITKAVNKRLALHMVEYLGQPLTRRLRLQGLRWCIALKE